jgi:hypothetical protein
VDPQAIAAGTDGHESRRHSSIRHASEPAQDDDREAGDADDWRQEHLEGWPHGDEGQRDAASAEQGRTRRDSSDDGPDEAANHQHKPE